MKKIFISFAVLGVFAACSKSSSDLVDSSTSTNNALVGAYSGEYTRSGNSQVGYFMIDLNIMYRYDGSSRDAGYPGICGGLYSLSPSTITFDDTCYTGGGFVLEGTYNYEKKGDSLEFSRTANGETENYRMARLIR